MRCALRRRRPDFADAVPDFGFAGCGPAMEMWHHRFGVRYSCKQSFWYRGLPAHMLCGDLALTGWFPRPAVGATAAEPRPLPAGVWAQVAGAYPGEQAPWRAELVAVVRLSCTPSPPRIVHSDCTYVVGGATAEGRVRPIFARNFAGVGRPQGSGGGGPTSNGRRPTWALWTALPGSATRLLMMQRGGRPWTRAGYGRRSGARAGLGCDARCNASPTSRWLCFATPLLA